jgi:hypothetical protein
MVRTLRTLLSDVGKCSCSLEHMMAQCLECSLKNASIDGMPESEAEPDGESDGRSKVHSLSL